MKQITSASIDEIEGERKNMGMSGRMNQIHKLITPMIQIGNTLKMNVDFGRDD